MHSILIGTAIIRVQYIYLMRYDDAEFILLTSLINLITYGQCTRVRVRYQLNKNILMTCNR